MFVAAREALLRLSSLLDRLLQRSEGLIPAWFYGLSLAWCCVGPLPLLPDHAEPGVDTLMRADAFKACARDHFCMAQSSLGAPDPWPWTRRRDPKDDAQWVVLPHQANDFATLQAWRWAKSHGALALVLTPKPAATWAAKARRRAGLARPADYGLPADRALLGPGGESSPGFPDEIISLLLLSIMGIFPVLMAWCLLAHLLGELGSNALGALRSGANGEPLAPWAWRGALCWMALASLCFGWAWLEGRPPADGRGPWLRLDAALACAQGPHCPLGSTASDSLLAQLGPATAPRSYSSSWLLLDKRQSAQGPALAQRVGDPQAFVPRFAPPRRAIDVWRPSLGDRLGAFVDRGASGQSTPVSSALDVARSRRRLGWLFLSLAGLILARRGAIACASRAGRWRGRARLEGRQGRLGLDFDQAFGLIDPAPAQAQAERLDLCESCENHAPAAKKPASRL